MEFVLEKECATCSYFGKDRNDQPCCGCFAKSNWELDEGCENEED